MYFVFFGDAKFSDLANHMTIIQVIGMSHGEQEPKSGSYYDSSIMTSSIMTSFILTSPGWRIYKTINAKYTHFCHQFTHFLVWFLKSL